MNSLLPNMRLLGLSCQDVSEWNEEVQKIDESMGAFGMDLSEEAVYLLFEGLSDGPVWVCRPVIGPLKELQAPFKLQDWKSAPVYRVELENPTWFELMDLAHEQWDSLQKSKLKYSPAFMIRLSRQIDSGLVLQT